ncbi:MAG: hypothetical protein EXR73_12790 [Myxococcales bacterium]|nr:hypothetical protein [Myxococcales bacterium]
MPSLVLAVALALLPLVAAPAFAEAPAAARALDLARYDFDPAKDRAADVGTRFLADLDSASPALGAAVREKSRYDLQDEEAAKFVRQRKYVIAAYAVLWMLLAGFAMTMYRRQTRLQLALDQLEARLRASSGT